jgi:predicted acylesterase/phospholipase RssA
MTETRHQNDYPVDPGRRCDIVMKGGITSGVVYPLALCRLARHFRLQNIGGTSAGAIGAVGAAAAEYGRRHQQGTHFRELEELPTWLGQTPEGSRDSNLFHLFQPQRTTRSLFALLVAAISNPGPAVALEVALSAVWNWRWWALVGGLPGVVVAGLLFVVLANEGGAWALVALVAGVLASIALAVVGALSVVGVGVYRTAKRRLAENGFGICRGTRTDTGVSSSGPEPLTEWLHGLIGRTSGVEILTFGDLWENEEGPREIDLAMITTCLTLGRPYRLPFRLEDGFYFNEQELRDYFPDQIVDHLVTHAGEAGLDGYLPLPPPGRLPIIFAARLSLSFPLLLSTVPLYQMNAKQEFRQCLFSDGGICSNFPIHFFDSALPRWPTFGINLAGPIGADGIDVWMPKGNLVGPRSGGREISNIVSFAGSIRGAMQNWHDNAHIELAGFRDRIVHVRFAEGEGGLNLNMPAELIATLSDRGDRAAAELVARFVDGHDAQGQPYELDWNNHRRIRLRLTLSALEELAISLAVGYTGDATIPVAPRRSLAHEPALGEETYTAIATHIADPPRHFEFDGDQRDLALTVLGIALPLARGWAAARGRDFPPAESPSFGYRGPEPPVAVRIVPPL